MAMKLEQVVPFGRSLDEYKKMFNLSATDLTQRILGVGDGPASFNAEVTTMGGHVTSIDPIYQFQGPEILQQFHAVVDDIIAQVKASPEDWVWSYHASPEALRQSRIQTIQTFIADYDRGQQAGRYQVAALPELPFPDQSFDLALCSHFLFLYSDHYDAAFHLDSVQAMLRVSREVRIFPLVTLMMQRSPHLEFVLRALEERGYSVTTVKVAYELQKGGNEMLVIQS
ncbi:SAM-dependent methyltransferase [Leptolyngbya sp. 'hensonii']|uniref:methyltransferase domain-containing protein n=1 Tax=Leptolyngbya sp. 'hensonii' TaxID=1922337 RepID=UPI00094FF13B|nr:class I SAM-dependent methyltransferase [Leptolyngbya sp. 'hensonii']OLP19762.1 SAM-dependent methyltransferase [Leptolyngbya sp. 'hensonii']